MRICGNTSNKRRLYIAYWARLRSPTANPPFHAGLLSMPKNPPTEQRIAIRYHIINRPIRNPDGTGSSHWTFQVDRIFPRTYKLVGLLLLGKVEEHIRDDDVQSILRGVAVIQGDEEWRCNNWIWDAVDSLVQLKVVKLPRGMTGKDVWERGHHFAAGVGETDPTTDSLPTCDRYGQAMSSEVGLIREN